MELFKKLMNDKYQFWPYYFVMTANIFWLIGILTVYMPMKWLEYHPKEQYQLECTCDPNKQVDIEK